LSRLHVSSGTTGKPIVVAYTKEDVEVWTSVMVRCLAGCGLHRGDIVQNAYGYGLFNRGPGRSLRAPKRWERRWSRHPVATPTGRSC